MFHKISEKKINVLKITLSNRNAYRQTDFYSEQSQNACNKPITEKKKII
jgi:hypothetical protein